MPFEQNAVGARIAGMISFAPAGESLRAQQRHIRNVVRTGQPGLLLLEFRIRLSDQAVGGQIKLSVRMQLISDRAPAAARRRQRRLIAQRVRMLEAAELAPTLVEFSGPARNSRPRVRAYAADSGK